MLATLLVSLLVALGFVATALDLRRFGRTGACHKRAAILISVSACLPAALTGYLGYHMWLNPLQTQSFTLGEVGHYRSETLVTPDGPAVLHIAQFPTRTLQLRLTRVSNAEGENLAMKTSEALRRFDADFAINASFFFPFKDNHLFDYYPHDGDPVRPVGQAYAEGVVHGVYEKHWPKFVVDRDGKFYFREGEMALADQSPNIQLVIAGKQLLVRDGINHVKDLPSDTPYPRSVLALSEDGTTLWCVVVDGKQPGYSEGLTLNALADFLIDQGIDTALELDGGGSATLVWKNARGDAEVLNRPSHTKIPHRERPVANHLLLYFQ